MKFLADECCDAGLVQSLRASGHDVLYISEENPGATDEEVLLLALKNKCILITEDTDFGELVYRLKKPAHGIILIRISVKDRHLKWEQLKKLIEIYPDRLEGRFIILDSEKFRFRPIMK